MARRRRWGASEVDDLRAALEAYLGAWCGDAQAKEFLASIEVW